MPQASKRKRLKEAMPVVGAVGVSLSLAGSAAAVGVVGADADVTPQKGTPEILITDEEISDISLGTFYVFDKENAGATHGEQYAQRGCRGCRGCAGCRGCRGCRGCGGGCLGGCGGCSCGCCLSWGACRLC